VVVKSLKLIFQHVEKLTILYKEVNCVKALRTVDLRGRGGHISTAKHKDNGLAARVKKCRFKRGINPRPY